MFLSTKPLKAGITWLKNRLVNSESNQHGELYRDLSLPLSLFIKCIVHSQLDCLIIKGKPKSEEIALAWAGIYSKYIDLNFENEVIYALQLQVEITLLISHISQTESCIYFLYNFYHEGLIEVLKLNGYKRPTNFEDKENWYKQLEVIQNKLARKKLALDGKIKEYEVYIKDKINNEISEQYFTTILLRLAKYQGVALIRAKDITVQEFVILLKDYLEYNKPKVEDGKEG